MGDEVRFNPWSLLALVVLGALLASELGGTAGSVTVLPYSEFQQLLSQEQVKEVVSEETSPQGRTPGRGSPASRSGRSSSPSPTPQGAAHTGSRAPMR